MFTRRLFTTSILAGSAAAIASHAMPAKAEDKTKVATPAKESKFPTHYRTVDIDGVSVFYREAGAPGAPVVLLLHGWPSSSRCFTISSRSYPPGIMCSRRIIPASATAVRPIARTLLTPSIISAR